MYSDTSQFSSKPEVTQCWKIMFWGSGILSLGTALMEFEGFWSSYLFDIVFPAYLYIYLRGLFHGRYIHRYLSQLSPTILFGMLILITFTMEICQYFGYYKGYYDPLDFLAYISLLGPCYLADRWLLKNRNRSGFE